MSKEPPYIWRFHLSHFDLVTTYNICIWLFVNYEQIYLDEKYVFYYPIFLNLDIYIKNFLKYLHTTYTFKIDTKFAVTSGSQST